MTVSHAQWGMRSRVWLRVLGPQFTDTTQTFLINKCKCFPLADEWEEHDLCSHTVSRLYMYIFDDMFAILVFLAYKELFLCSFDMLWHFKLFAPDWWSCLQFDNVLLSIKSTVLAVLSTSTLTFFKCMKQYNRMIFLRVFFFPVLKENQIVYQL